MKTNTHRHQKQEEYGASRPTGEEYILQGLQMMKDEFSTLLEETKNEYIKMLWENVERWVKNERKWLKLVSKLEKEYCVCDKEKIPAGLRDAIEAILDYSRNRRKYLRGKV